MLVFVPAVRAHVVEGLATEVAAVRLEVQVPVLVVRQVLLPGEGLRAVAALEGSLPGGLRVVTY